MKHIVNAVILVVLFNSWCYAATRKIEATANPAEVALGETIRLECTVSERWQLPLTSAKIKIRNLELPAGKRLVVKDDMVIDGMTASYEYTLQSDQQAGNWKYICVIRDRSAKKAARARYTVVEPLPEPPVISPPPPAPPTPPTSPPIEFEDGPIAAHNTITDYNGPSTCIACHQQEAEEMLGSLHMKWSGPTAKLSNTDGEEKGKAVDGINTFCTYAMSSKAACFSCHVRADGNAPDPAQAEDVDCLMCHSDTYQRKFISDPENTVTVENVLGEIKTYVFGKTDAQGNYTTVPDFDKMPENTHMVNVARQVHIPTNQSCLRCHAKAGGGDWTKRGDIGLNSAHATFEQDVHLAKDGAGLACINCHSALNHKISGRGIDLRQTEAVSPTCKSCHDDTPHSNSTLNRHAQGQISCQVCHIRKFAKGGATEMSRDWSNPVWNAAFCSGQGGFVGEEVKQANVTPEYVWFDGTSSVYNVGETISADDRGIYPMARANGGPFDGKSFIVPIKRHFSSMPLHESGKIVPPVIMWMFMTGDFDIAVQKGMEEQGMTGSYSIVEADAEMLISHGVDPKEKAPSCNECHDSSGSTDDGTGMIPFEALGYHEVPDKVRSCDLCHEEESMQWEAMHQKHRQQGLACISCHTTEPAGLTRAENELCSSCHGRKSWRSEGHKKHIEKGLTCSSCHIFS